MALCNLESIIRAKNHGSPYIGGIHKGDQFRLPNINKQIFNFWRFLLRSHNISRAADGSNLRYRDTQQTDNP
ncbi:hypothetical protein BH23BAC3_BH23BAC3_25420 [soil metagenome]